MRCLAALRWQSFSNDEYEVIVVTDGPDELTQQKFLSFNNEYDLKNFIYTSLDYRKGPAAARNKGASIAKGELLVFTDDDCIPCIKWLYQYWKRYLLHGRSYVAFSGQTIVPCADKPTDYEKNIAHLETAEFITANCACTRKTFQLVKGFDEDFSIAWREDSALHFKLISLSIPVIKVSKAIIIHPVREAAWGVSLQEQKKSFYNALLYKKHPFLYRKKISRRPLWNYYAMVFLFVFALINMIEHNSIIAFFSLVCWLLLVVLFMLKRLNGTSKEASHIIEMAVTSAAIPFLSVFWTLYGSLRYKKLLL